MNRILKAVVFPVAPLGLVFLAATFPDTNIRPAPLSSPGYTNTTAPAPHRGEPLPVHAWYPTDQRDAPDLLAQNALLYGHYAQTDATPATGPFPVVLLSRVPGGNALQLGGLVRERALSGTILVATNHPGTTSRDSDPFQTIRVWERPADLPTLRDRVTYSDLPVDAARLAVVGFSLDGHSAMPLSGARVSKAGFIAYCASPAEKPDCDWMADGGVDFDTIDHPRYEAEMRDALTRRIVGLLSEASK